MVKKILLACCLAVISLASPVCNATDTDKDTYSIQPISPEQDPDRLGTFLEFMPDDIKPTMALPQAPPEYDEALIHMMKANKVSDKLAMLILKNVREQETEQAPASLIMSIMLKESTFRPWVKSKDGSLGLMQVRAKVHHRLIQSLGVRNVFSVDGNILLGSTLLKQYIQRAEGNLFLALKRYSGGSEKYAASVLKTMAVLTSVQTQG